MLICAKIYNMNESQGPHFESEQPKPYELWNDPLVISAAEDDPHLQTALENCQRTQQFLDNRGTPADKMLFDLSHEALGEYIERYGIITSKPPEES